MDNVVRVREVIVLGKARKRTPRENGLVLCDNSTNSVQKDTTLTMSSRAASTNSRFVPRQFLLDILPYFISSIHFLFFRIPRHSNRPWKRSKAVDFRVRFEFRRPQTRRLSSASTHWIHFLFWNVLFHSPNFRGPRYLNWPKLADILRDASTVVRISVVRQTSLSFLHPLTRFTRFLRSHSLDHDSRFKVEKGQNGLFFASNSKRHVPSQPKRFIATKLVPQRLYIQYDWMHRPPRCLFHTSFVVIMFMVKSNSLWLAWDKNKVLVSWLTYSTSWVYPFGHTLWFQTTWWYSQ